MEISKQQKKVILAVTFGNILEWYQAYSYVYFAPILATKFFHFSSDDANLFMAFVVFGIGFLTRPFGGILFGRIGDRYGRKKAFMLSILTMTIPTFLIGCLPTYLSWGMGACVGLILLRFIQAIPESGESPGSFCFLYENSASDNRKFMSSWGAFGNQIGALLGIIETLVLDRMMPEAFLETWGWRISFWVGALVGLLGFFLRKSLDETPVFQELREHHRWKNQKLYMVLGTQKKKIVTGVAYGLINASTFYLLATYLPSYLNSAIGLCYKRNAMVSITILILTTVLLPFFGWIAERISVRKLLISSALAIIVLLFPLCYFMCNQHISLVIVFVYMMVVPVSCITALLPYLLMRLFPAEDRFTGSALSYNLADGLVGGFTPALALLLAAYTKMQAGFFWLVIVCSMLSLRAYIKMR